MTTDPRKPSPEVQARLAPLVGAWDVSVALGDDPLTGRATIEWALDETYLLVRSAMQAPVPDSLSVIAHDAARDAFTQHYFDARGVVRLYAMTVGDGAWTLERTAPDFSPLDFGQRFTGTFAADGATIAARWEKAPAGQAWELDFELTYTRVA